MCKSRSYPPSNFFAAEFLGVIRVPVRATQARLGHGREGETACPPLCRLCCELALEAHDPRARSQALRALGDEAGGITLLMRVVAVWWPRDFRRSWLWQWLGCSAAGFLMVEEAAAPGWPNSVAWLWTFPENSSKKLFLGHPMILKPFSRLS